MKDLFFILSDLEKDENIHLGRLLLLLAIFSGDKGDGEIEGLTKLAKLDFLLRYPGYLERALFAINKSMSRGQMKEYERKSVEAKMVRFKYGPWDFRYRRFINVMIGMGFVTMRKNGRTYSLKITEQGKAASGKLAETGTFNDTIERAKIIKSNFNYSGTHLMKFIYNTFPEIGTLQYGTEIL